MNDKKPVIPSNFPSELKEVVNQGWSKDPKERPPVQKFKSALNKMLTGDKKVLSQTLPEKHSINEENKHFLSSAEVNSERKTAEEMGTTKREAGKPF